VPDTDSTADTTACPCQGSFRHLLYKGHGVALAELAIGTVTLLKAAALAREPPSPTEARIFRLANSLPTRGYLLAWMPMQYGTFGAVPVAASFALARRRPRLALAIGAGGVAAWLLAKGVKSIVGRGRPASVLQGVVRRGAEKGDLGFPSGHAAVSAALTVTSWPYVSDRWRGPLAALSGFVPIARMYVGVHLPLDVVGGSALGLAIGGAINLAFPRAAPDSPDRRGFGRERVTDTVRRSRRGSDSRLGRRRPRAGTAGRTTIRHLDRTTGPARRPEEATIGR
jgi:membrane-associated phospholipid phosphatase